MVQFGSIITNIGLAKISNAQITNSTIGIESMVLGDGNGAYYTVSQSQTALRNEVWHGLLADQWIDANNPNRIEFSAFIPSTVGGFTIREVGLLDTDGNLIALSLYPEQYKPTLGEGISDDILIHFVIETSNASVITLAVDVTNVIATRQYVDRKTAEVNNVLTEHLEQSKMYALLNKTSVQAMGAGINVVTFDDLVNVNDADFCILDAGKLKVTEAGNYLVICNLNKSGLVESNIEININNHTPISIPKNKEASIQIINVVSLQANAFINVNIYNPTNTVFNVETYATHMTIARLM